MRLIIVRHGETKENVAKIVYGHMPGELTENGIDQANKTGVALMTENIDIVYSSDLKRCVDTANIIMSYIKPCTLKTTRLLREQQQDSLNGKKVDEVDWNNLPVDVENEKQMSERGTQLLSETYSEFNNKTVLFVTHKRFANILANILLRKDHNDKTNLEKVSNSSFSVFNVNENLEGHPEILHSTSHI